MMGAGKLGMYLAAPDNIETIVNQFKGDFNKYGLGPIPGGTATLAGGEGYMFKADATPEKINAGLKWLTFWWNNPDRIESEHQYAADNKNPVGLPEPMLWTGDAKSKQEAATAKLKNLPTDNYTPFASATASIPLKLEPPNAQQIYAVLDVPMLKVLTDKNADIDALLATAENQVNAILAASSRTESPEVAAAGPETARRRPPRTSERVAENGGRYGRTPAGNADTQPPQPEDPGQPDGVRLHGGRHRLLRVVLVVSRWSAASS